MKTQFISKEDSEKTCFARGFSSLKEWAKENEKGQQVNRRRPELVKALVWEYDNYITPHLTR